MTPYLTWALLVVCVELVANVLLFPLITRLAGAATGQGNSVWFCGWRKFWKGELERCMLVLGLWVEVPHVFILLGALKIGSHIRDDTNQVPNDYFIIGNTASVLLCLGYWLAKYRLIG